jgi:hypothetical protein
MTKIQRIALMLAIALFAVASLVGCLAREPEELVTIQSIGNRPLVPCEAFVEVNELDTDKWYILIDISDNANYPHARTGSINLKQLSHTGVLSETTHWDIKFGVVGSVNITETYVEWIHIDHRVRTTQFHWDWTLPEHGLNLAVKSDGTLWNVATVAVTTATGITTTTPISTAGIYSNNVGIGDLIMFVEEIDPGGFIKHLSVGALYGTE